MSESKMVEMLQEMKASLTEETHFKGKYFTVKNNHICMCIHGAADAVCNPRVKKILSSYTGDRAVRANSEANFPPYVNTIRHKNSSKETWDSRPDYIKQDFIYQNINYGNRDLHFLLYMVGATIIWNDLPTTTLEMVHAKIDEAIVLAGVLSI